MKLFCLLVIVLCVSEFNYIYAATLSSNELHTKTYYKWKAGFFTFNFYQSNTYMDSDPLQPIKDGKEFRNLLRYSNIMCTGHWCKDGQFKCPNNTNECYHTEHIVDMRNSIGPNDHPCKNIAGNLIMAYGKWNKEIGQLKWENALAEKKEIYDEYIVNTAINSVQTCLDMNYIVECDDNIDIIIVQSLSIVALLIVVFIMCCINCNKNKKDTLYVKMDILADNETVV